MKMKLLFAILVALPFCGFAQNTVDTSELSPTAKLLLKRSFQFNATYVQPMSGRERNVMSDNYTLKVSKDEVVSELPYFGKSTSAPIGTSDVGMKFSSKEFTYDSKSLTKSREQIIIKPKDVTDINEIYFLIYPDGTADLRITSNSRQAISYRGNIVSIKAAE